MYKIRDAIAKHGNIWTLSTNTEMTELYEPLHAQQAEKFSETVKVLKALKYGDHERHRLDVYMPVAPASQGQSPLVVFLHGGMEVTASRRGDWY
jgi:acetyl esterase